MLKILMQKKSSGFSFYYESSNYNCKYLQVEMLELLTTTSGTLYFVVKMLIHLQLLPTPFIM
ncbi:hypothetical protein SAMN04487898_105157 [Pedobacter sp. ok626]|uniref:hypothetical protein n=1 Tax=Pedobacter sp. ok626 TaxID=1761882 RepID=UPI00088688DB|nr:hypothetical protein [Pedobacter sp. ok626]SDJ96023.1 hypothetical protein SAMN04487898_105157 [Pedobacter sp. ok626]